VERAFSVLAAKKHVQPVQIAAALHIRLPLLEDLVGFPLTGSAADARRRPALSIVK
jgi:hypothetical protein